MLSRGSHEIHGAKVLPLFVSDRDAARFDPQDHDSLAGICRYLRTIGPAGAAVAFLATVRPATYFEYPPWLTENFLIELPGGGAHPGEDLLTEALRELREELRIAEGQVIGVAPLTADSMPWDSGAHAEWMSLAVAICRGVPDPLPVEGIIVAECRNIPLTGLDAFFAEMRTRGVGIDGFVPTALALLSQAMRGGWSDAWT